MQDVHCRGNCCKGGMEKIERLEQWMRPVAYPAYACASVVLIKRLFLLRSWHLLV